MTAFPLEKRGVQPLTVRLIKLIALAALGLLLWRVPAMVAHTSPKNAVVLGRYTSKYFALMAVYLGGVATWAVASIWCALTLNPERLARVRRTIEDHLDLALGLFVALTAGLLAARSTMLAGIIGFPPAFDKAMRHIPFLFYSMFLVLTALVIGQRIPQLVERRLATAWQAPRQWLQSRARLQQPLTRLRIDLLAGFFVIAGILVTLTLRKEFWNFPLGLDPGLHVYLGRHVLNGGVPYRTILLFHPPARIAVSLLWNLGADVSGLPLVHFIRGVELCIAGGILAVTYEIGRKLTGRPAGGLLAGAILLGTEHLNELVIRGPNFRMTTILFMLGGLSMAQRRRWFWSGVLAALATLVYSPAGVAMLAIVLSALLEAQDGKSRLQTVRRAMSGFGLIVAAAGIALALSGVLDEAYRQAVAFVPRLVSGKIETPEHSVGEQIARYRSVFGWVLRGDWELAVLMALGALSVLLTDGVRNAIRATKSSGLLFALAFMLFAYGIDFDSGVRDTVMIFALAAPFGARLLTDLFARLDGSSQQGVPHLRTTLEWVALGMLLVYGVSDAVMHRRFLYSLADVPLDEQQRLSRQLENALQPGETVQPMGNLWFLALSGHDNPTPFIQWHGEGLLVAESAGWTVEGMVQEVESQQPVVVMAFPRSLDQHPAEVAAWLDRHYAMVGQFNPETNVGQDIYVRKGRDDIMQIIASWPLAENRTGS